VVGKPLPEPTSSALSDKVCAAAHATERLIMNKRMLLAIALGCCICAAWASEKTQAPNFEPTEVASTGSVTVGGKRIDYRAVAGTLLVHARGWNANAAPNDKKNPTAEASMFYVAYFERHTPSADRPITFLFNGGPGSSSVWLHMGAFGPVRVLTADHTHTPPAPYRTVSNDESLLDVSDLVFVDAPGTGFSRLRGQSAAKSFYGVDQDIHAFAVFIREFLSKYNRWNSPKYLYGESYGTMRAAGLPLALEKEDIDLNGVMLQSDILDWDLMPDNPRLNPSVDLPYVVALPSYAATAWYHHRLPDEPQHLLPFLAQVEHFATHEYALALMRGNSLSSAHRQAIAKELHEYTGLSLAYLLKSDLRIEYGAFQKELLASQDLTTGTLDTRFTGPTLDPLSELSQYDPQSAAIGSAYIAAFNTYVRERLHYGKDLHYRPGIPIYGSWDYRHQPPGAHRPLIALPNVLPDLAVAMKRDPDMKVMVNGGYFDISTPFYEGWFEMHHLPIPPDLQRNIEYRYYKSGHMIYVHLPALKQLHDNVAAFIRTTDNLK
jgi:carboxypeptidase C (cathepsin A)